MEHAIGERIILEVTEGEGCEGCFFKDFGTCITVLECEFRTDGKDVIYKEIKEDK